MNTDQIGVTNGTIHARMYWPDILSEQDVRNFALREITQVHQFQSLPVPPEAECAAYADGYWQGYQAELVVIREEEGL